MNCQLTVTPEAVERIRAKGGSVTVESSHTVNGCCLAATFEPQIEWGAPRNPDSFEPLLVDGITVYVDTKLYASRPLTLTVSRFLGFSRLVIDGWKVI